MLKKPARGTDGLSTIIKQPYSADDATFALWNHLTPDQRGHARAAAQGADIHPTMSR
jgi:hypothetical protein